MRALGHSRSVDCLTGPLQQTSGTPDDRRVDHLIIHHEDPFAAGAGSQNALCPGQLFRGGHQRFVHHSNLARVNTQQAAKTHVTGVCRGFGKPLQILDIGKNTVQRRRQPGQS